MKLTLELSLLRGGRMGGRQGVTPLNILADMLTLFELGGGQITPTTLVLTPPRIFRPSYDCEVKAEAMTIWLGQNVYLKIGPYMSFSLGNHP